jgi:hypothetical protein
LEFLLLGLEFFIDKDLGSGQNARPSPRWRNW